MREARLLATAILISSFVHLLILVGISSFRLPLLQKSKQPIHVSYKVVQREIPKEAQYKEVKVEAKTEKAKIPVEILSKEFGQAQVFNQPSSKQSGILKLDKKATSKIETMDIHRKVTIPILKSERITNPKYLGYNHDIEYKIKKGIYKYLNHPKFISGKVCLTFVLLSSGVLKQAKIVEDKTEANDYLKAIILKTLQEASPFTPFPKDLNYPELPFSVTIVFEKE